MRSKLYQMGLVPGARVLIMRGNSAGPTFVAIRDSKLAIGRVMPQKISVG